MGGRSFSETLAFVKIQCTQTNFQPYTNTHNMSDASLRVECHIAEAKRLGHAAEAERNLRTSESARVRTFLEMPSCSRGQTAMSQLRQKSESAIHGLHLLASSAIR